MWVYIEETDCMFDTNTYEWIGTENGKRNIYGIKKNDDKEVILYTSDNKNKVKYAFEKIKEGLETYKGMVRIEKKNTDNLPNHANIGTIGLSARTLNPLVRNGILSVEDITKIGVKGLKKIDGLGPKAIDEIIEKVNGILLD